MQQSREMAAVVAHRLKHREPTTATDHLVCASLDFIKRHDAAIFATVRMVNLTIMRLMGCDGPNDFGEMERLLRGSDEGCKKKTDLKKVEGLYGDAYCSFYRRFIEIMKAVELIPTSTTIPAESKAKLADLAKQFPKNILVSIFGAIDTGYYRRTESIQSQSDVFQNYLFHPEAIVEMEDLEIKDIHFCGIYQDLVKLGAEIQGPAKYDLSKARNVARDLMGWVVRVMCNVEKPTSNRGRKKVYKQALQEQKEELERKFTK